MSEMYLGFWADVDLGNASDDFVGSDTTLGMAVTYNGHDTDDGFDGYGDRPPAIGIDFVQGPLVPDTSYYGLNTWIDPDGTEYPGMQRRKMTTFMYYNGDGSVQGNPDGNSDDPYQYLQGIWRDGTPITFGGTGYGGQIPISFMFPGNAADREFWSEENTDGSGSRNTPADRKFLMSTGPFDMPVGAVQEVIVAIVWSQSENRLASYRKLINDNIAVQGFYENNFKWMEIPDAPQLSAEVHDGRAALTWENTPASNNYLDSYNENSSFLVDPTPLSGNITYSFEGYQVYQYRSASDSIGTLVATYDIQNEIKAVADFFIDPVTGLSRNRHCS